MTPAPRWRCLWLARALPFPQDSGDRIYSARLARSLAQAGARVHFVGHAPAPPASVPQGWPIEWEAIEGGTLPTWQALASLQPLNGAIHATPAYRRRLAELLQREWDMVVIDHYGMAWALPEVEHLTRDCARPPVTVHVAHNHEATLWQDMVRRFRGPPLRKLGLWQNMRKIERVERRLAASVDLLTCITPEDAGNFVQLSGARRTLVLTPGHDGLQMPDRSLRLDTPRRVLMVGSFRWVAKQENLKALAQAADTLFRQHKIGLDVVGDVPPELRLALAPYTSISLHGFVDDIAPYFRSARMAIVPELIGGGFKLKFLDYIFGRIAVVTLDQAAAGVPAAVRSAMLGCVSLADLVATVVARIDDLAALDRLQRDAFTAAASAFHWPDRGAALLGAVRELTPRPSRAAWFMKPARRAGA